MRRESFLEPAFYFYRFYYMKKVGLLFLALASCCAGAFAGDAFYIIKDGKFQNGVQFSPYEDAEKTDTEIAEGDGFATITHKGDYSKALEARLSVPDGLSLSTKSIIVEYEVDALDIYNDDNESTAAGISKPTIIIECLDVENGAWVDNFDTEAGEARNYLLNKIFIDGKGEGCDKKWNTFKSYSFPVRDAFVKTLLIAYKREVSAVTESVLKIKNLYFETDEDNIPIFGCQFMSLNDYEETKSLNTFNNENHIKWMYQNGIKLNWTEGNNYAKLKDATLFISYEGVLADASGFPASEFNSSLLVLAPPSTAKGDNEFSIWFDTIPLPEAAIEAGKIKLECFAKHYGKEKVTMVGNVDGVNQDELLPIYVSFDNSEEAVPAFKDSIINGQWTKEVGEITVPAGAKSVFIEFRQNKQFSYIVDKFVVSYKGKVGVATVDGESKTLTVYPNPVEDAIAFTGVEDIQSVEIVSLNGAVNACKVVNNIVEVSNLAAGEYVIIVNKNITGKFIKK